MSAAEPEFDWKSIETEADEEIEFAPDGVTSVPVEIPAGRDREQDGATATSDTSTERWRPVAITEAAAVEPTVRAAHAFGLVYDSGAVTLVSGEPGVGKSMFLAAVVAEESRAGRRSLYIDFERTPGMLLERLRLAGLTDDELALISYLRPGGPAKPDAIRAMVDTAQPALVVVDSYDAALAAFGLEPKNEDVRAFARLVLDPLRSAGAPLVVADHVTKDREKRGRFSIGGQAKLALAEAHIGLTAIAPLRRGATGRLKAHVHKDTYGWLPTTVIVEIASHPDTGALTWDVRADDSGATAGEDTWRPTILMDRVLEYLAAHPEPISRSALADAVKGKRQYVLEAIDALLDDERIAHDGRQLVPVPRNVPGTGNGERGTFPPSTEGAGNGNDSHHGSDL